MKPNPLLEARQALMLEQALLHGPKPGTEPIYVVRLLIAKAMLAALMARLGSR